MHLVIIINYISSNLATDFPEFQQVIDAVLKEKNL
jgi:hypothetical protein